jgi:hypothetical protein
VSPSVDVLTALPDIAINVFNFASHWISLIVSVPNPVETTCAHTLPSVEYAIFPDSDAAKYFESPSAQHTAFMLDVEKLGVAEFVQTSTGAVKLLEIVPLTPRFISVGLVMFVDNAAPSFMTRIFLVLPAAVAALA